MSWLDDVKAEVKGLEPELRDQIKKSATTAITRIINPEKKQTPKVSVMASAAQDYGKYIPFVVIGIVAYMLLKRR